MKKIIALAAVAAALSTSTSAFAQSVGQTYGEAMYDVISVKDVSEEMGTVKPKAVRLNAGMVVIDNLAIEGNFVMGTGSASYSDASDVSVKVKNGYGIALRPFVNLTKDLELFGRIGKSRTKTEWQAGNDSGSDTTTDTVYGLGLAYAVTKDVRAVVDYTKSPEKDGSKVSRMGVGVRFNF
jgi:opacity protein-like surface antigen